MQKQNVVQLSANQTALAQSLATVVETKNGCAVSVDINGKTHQVTGHGRSVAHLHEQDQVLVMHNGEQCIVTDIVDSQHKPAQSFTVENGIAKLDGVNAISLQTQKGEITIDLNGRIFLQGKELYSRAELDNVVTGRVVKIN
ncbi:hypothetical protein [Salinibius halmophilus]|uniref:hypothetical protein n=1 Tax=Salinibius halmophilus TaxID=1853216 RepID=UPI000E66036B|nr:hypothetical protein [Salinibius halmophilus]